MPLSSHARGLLVECAPSSPQLPKLKTQGTLLDLPSWMVPSLLVATPKAQPEARRLWRTPAAFHQGTKYNAAVHAA